MNKLPEKNIMLSILLYGYVIFLFSSLVISIAIRLIPSVVDWNIPTAEFSFYATSLKGCVFSVWILAYFVLQISFWALPDFSLLFPYDVKSCRQAKVWPLRLSCPVAPGRVASYFFVVTWRFNGSDQTKQQSVPKKSSEDLILFPSSKEFYVSILQR